MFNLNYLAVGLGSFFVGVALTLLVVLSVDK